MQMERAERAAIHIFVFGVGFAMMGVAGPLAFPDAPKVFWQVIVALGAIFTVVSATFLIYEYRESVRQKRMIAVFGMIVSGMLFVGFAGWHFWPRSKESKETQHQREAENKLPRVSIDCRQQILPKTVPANETLEVLWLFPTPTENGGGGLATQFSGSGQPWKWPIDDPMRAVFISAYRCDVANYSDAPVYELQMILRLTFFEAVPSPNQNGAKTYGNIKLDRDWLISIPKIEAGPQSAFTFYIINNQPDLFVNVMMPSTSTLRWLGNDRRSEINLTGTDLGRTRPLQFNPNLGLEPPQQKEL